MRSAASLAAWPSAKKSSSTSGEAIHVPSYGLLNTGARVSLSTQENIGTVQVSARCIKVNSFSWNTLPIP